jgi:cobalt-zinc-cadmium efflux system outer membrane protein
LGTTVFGRGAWLLASGIVCIFTSAPLYAETQKLTLPHVVELSLQNNSELKLFREEKGIHDIGKIRADLLPNPTLDIEAGTGALTGSSADNSLALGVSQEFFLAGKREKRRAVAEKELEIFRWQLADRERLLRAEAKTAFYEVILAEQRIALSDRFMALNRQLLDVTKERFAAGDIPELEMNLAKVELAQSEGARIDVAKALYASEIRLRTLMGLSPGEPVALKGTLETEVVLTKSLTELKQLARESRPDFKTVEAEKSRGDADIVLAQAEGVPNLTAGLVFRRDATSMEIGGVREKDTGYTVGVKLSMPIPLFDNNQAGVQEARVKRSNADSRLATTGSSVERDVETAFADYRNNEKILSLYTLNIIPQLEENLKLTQEAYRLGEVGILAVIQEQKKFFEINNGYLAALYARQSAFVNLESAVASDLIGGVK